MLILKLAGIRYIYKLEGIYQWLCKINRLSTGDHPRKAVASKTFKEQSERIGLLLTSMASTIHKSFHNVPVFTYYHGYKATVVLKLNVWVSIFHRILDQI